MSKQAGTTDDSGSIIHIYIDKLNSLSRQHAASKFEIANTLYAISSNGLHSFLGYRSFSQFVKDHLVFGVASARDYVCIRKHQKRLKYNKTESISMFERIPNKAIVHTLPSLDCKLSIAQLQKAVEKHEARGIQVSFFLDPKDMTFFERRLSSLGLEITEGGVRKNLSGAVVALAKDHARLTRLVKKQAAKA